MMGYINIIWNDKFPFDYPDVNVATAGDFYLLKAQEAWNKNESFNGIPLERRIRRPGLDDDPTNADVDMDKTKDNEDIENRYLSGIMEIKVPMLLFCPKLLAAYAKKSNWDVKLAHQTIGPLLDQLMTRRQMESSLNLPNGTETCVGAGMPKLTIKTIELRHTAESLRTIRTQMERFDNRIIRKQKNIIPTYVGNGQVIQRPTIQINSSVVRQLSLISIYPHNHAAPNCFYCYKE